MSGNEVSACNGPSLRGTPPGSQRPGRWRWRRGGPAVTAAVTATIAGVLSACGTVAPAHRTASHPASTGSTGQPQLPSAPASPPAGPAGWRIAGITGGAGSEFAAVTATGAGDAWVFETPGPYKARPIAWRLSGSTWTRLPFPDLPGESVGSAASSADDNIWAFTARRALRWNGSGWSVIGRLRLTIGSGLVISPSDVGYSENPMSPAPAWAPGTTTAPTGPAFRPAGGCTARARCHPTASGHSAARPWRTGPGTDGPGLPLPRTCRLAPRCATRI